MIEAIALLGYTFIALFLIAIITILVGDYLDD
jgi:hypothetical protein